MSEVNRYDIGGMADGGIDVQQFPDGYWVKHEDYAELKAERDALSAENVVLKESVDHAAGCIHAAEVEGLEDALESNDGERLADLIHRRLCHAHLPVVTPATDAYLNSVRAEGIHFAANRMLAAWESGFIDDTPAQVHDISGAVLSALEFLPNASPEEFKRDYADEVRSAIASQLRAGKDGRNA